MLARESRRIGRMSRKPSDRSDDGGDDDRQGRDDGSIGPSSRRSTQTDDFSVRRARDRYGDDYTIDELRRIHQMEQSYGSHIKDWADEGMPLRAMKNQDAREAFRLQKGTPIPKNIDKFNRKSERRNMEYLNRMRRKEPDGETRVPDSVRKVISSPGQSLDDSVRRAMEDRIGGSFEDVRIHAGPKAAEAAEAIDARAFAVGNHIAFNYGEYDPGSVEGQHVLAHELAHVRQQTLGQISMLPNESIAVELTSGRNSQREVDYGRTTEVNEKTRSSDVSVVCRLLDTDIHVQRTDGERLSPSIQRVTEDTNKVKNWTGQSSYIIDNRIVIQRMKKKDAISKINDRSDSLTKQERERLVGAVDAETVNPETAAEIIELRHSGRLSGGADVNDLLDITEKATIKNVKRVVRTKNGPIWLESGNKDAGLQHILTRHPEFGDQAYLTTSDLSVGVEEMIVEAIENGERVVINGSIFYQYQKAGDWISVLVGSNGFVVTAYPGKKKST